MKKNIVDLFWSIPKINGKTIFTEENRMSDNILQVFYFLILFVAFQAFTFNSQLATWDEIVQSQNYFEPLWSTIWLNYVDWESGVRFIFILFAFFSVLGLIFWKESRLVRAGVAISLFLYVSLLSSFTIIDHYLHIMIVASAMLVMLPKKESVNVNINYLKVIFGIQTLILLTYFTSGSYKFYGILQQLKWGQESVFSLGSLARNATKTSYFSGNDYFFLDFISNNVSFGFSALLILGYIIECISIIFIFKPKYHKIWGLVLILMHFFIATTVGPDFSYHSLVLGVFLLMSPFGANINSLLGDFFQYVKSKGRKTKRA